jgi:hypothetical protein
MHALMDEVVEKLGVCLFSPPLDGSRLVGNKDTHRGRTADGIRTFSIYG